MLLDSSLVHDQNLQAWRDIGNGTRVSSCAAVITDALPSTRRRRLDQLLPQGITESFFCGGGTAGIYASGVGATGLREPKDPSVGHVQPMAGRAGDSPAIFAHRAGIRAKPD